MLSFAVFGYAFPCCEMSGQFASEAILAAYICNSVAHELLVGAIHCCDELGVFLKQPANSFVCVIHRYVLIAFHHIYVPQVTDSIIH